MTVSDSFEIGDKVRIVENEKNENIVFEISKIKKSADGSLLYLLKRESSPITLLYYESDESYLEKA